MTTDVGPRIIFFGFAGGKNVFQNYDEMLQNPKIDEFQLYGGHRLWHAPENQPRTYYPDNHPVKIVDMGEFIQTTQPIETTTGVEKQMDIYLDPTEAEVKIVHRLTNHNIWGIELAAWSLSVMAPGGKAIVPLPTRGSHTEGDLLPSNTVTLWSYTNMADERWSWGNQYATLQSQPGNEIPQKGGFMVKDGWSAYVNNELLFVKYFDYLQEFAYADLGCNVETFTNESMLELETLGPLCWLLPGESVEHIEIWNLFDGVKTPKTEEEINQHILPKIELD